MTAQIDLDGVSKPAQVKSRCALNDEWCFREVVLSSDQLQHCGWQPVGQKTNSGWIAGKEPASKRIDVVVRNIHCKVFFNSAAEWISRVPAAFCCSRSRFSQICLSPSLRAGTMS